MQTDEMMRILNLQLQFMNNEINFYTKQIGVIDELIKADKEIPLFMIEQRKKYCMDLESAKAAAISIQQNNELFKSKLN